MDVMSYLMGKKSGGSGATIEVVTELPDTGQPNVIYLVPKQTTGTNNIFDEYLWVGNAWELIGSTDIDLSNYLAKNNTTAFTPSGDYNPATKKYVDDNKGQTIQYSTMPTASASTVGKIVQYTGTTDANYTNGYFYIGTSTTASDVTTYNWENLNVQSGGSSGVTVLTEDTDLRQMPSGVYINGKQNANFIKVKIGSNGGDNQGQVTIYSNCVFNWTNNALTDISLTSPQNSLLTVMHSPLYDSYQPYLRAFYVTVVTSNNIRSNGTVSNAIQIGLNQLVLTSGNQGIYGTKTFYQVPVCSSAPTNNNDLANKKYVDDSITTAITTTLGGSY